MKKISALMIGLLVLGLVVFGLGCDGSGRPGGCNSNPTPQPYISGAGIGVGNLQQSMDFYQTVLELDYAGRQPGKLDRIVEEVILTDRDGQKLYLMDFGPDEDYNRRPCKLVWAVPNARTYYNRVLANGGSSVSAPAPILGTTVALTRDPNGYIIELMGIESTPRPLLVGVGVGASNLPNSRAFYENVIGMQYSSGMPVPGLMVERILVSQKDIGPSLVIMDFEAAMNYNNAPVKVVFNVDDAVAFANAIADDDPNNIIIQPTANSVGYAKDIEGTLMEIVQD